MGSAAASVAVRRALAPNSGALEFTERCGATAGPANREGGGGHRASTLTVRAKKSDCEDFAKGKLTAEQFGKQALVNLH